MISSSIALAAVANIFISQSLALYVPAGPGIPASNGPGMVCYNDWEDATSEHLVQYWYVVVPGAQNNIKADRVWNHLNLNGCAPTENKYYVNDNINGCSLTFHTSEACTADRVSKALRSGSDPAMNIACQFNGKPGSSGNDVGEGVATGLDGAIEGILEALGGKT